MAYKVTEKAFNGCVTIVADTDDDVRNIPTSYTAGSVIVVAASGGGIYMLNASGEWVKQ